MAGTWDATGGTFTSSGTVTFDGGPPPPAAMVIDNGDAGYSSTASWAYWNNQGYQGDIEEDFAGTGSDTATWTFSVAAGSSWKVAATWTEFWNRATDAPFTIFDGDTPLLTVDVNQQVAANDFAYDGANWEWLSGDSYTITSGMLKVQLSDDANGNLNADAIYIEYVEQLPVIISDDNTFFNVSFEGGSFSNTDELHAANDVTIAGGAFTLRACLDVDGDLAISSGALDVSASNYAIEVGGSWNQTGGTFDPQGGEVAFDGTSGSHQIDSGGQAFHDLTVSGSGGTWTLEDDLDVDGDVSLSHGTLAASNYTISAAGDWDNSAGASGLSTGRARSTWTARDADRSAARRTSTTCRSPRPPPGPSTSSPVRRHRSPRAVR